MQTQIQFETQTCFFHNNKKNRIKDLRKTSCGLQISPHAESWSLIHLLRPEKYWFIEFHLTNTTSCQK